jgi:hypothetical protein
VGTTFSRPPGDIPGNLDQPAVEAVGRPAVSPAAETVRPYPPSWIDRLTDWVRGLPFPAWAFYLAVGPTISLVYFLLLVWYFGWDSESLSLGIAMLFAFLSGLTPVYLVALIHYLDDWAAAALARFRPVLALDEAGYDNVHYRLTTLPAGPALIATFLGAVYTVGSLLIGTLTRGRTIEWLLPGLVAFFWSIFLIFVLVAVLVYHTLHQLRTVNDIYTGHTRINIFQQGPLYALSGLTARTAVGIAIPQYLWFQAFGITEVGISANDIVQGILFAIILIITFISPLLGAHRLLEREKQRLQDEAARSIEAAIAEVNSRVAGGELVVAGEMKEALEVLLLEQGVIDKLRTWPWRTETVRGLGVAFFLPIFIWLVQRVLERLGI